MIGIIDHAKQKDKRSSFSSGNAMCYFGWKGSKWPENVVEGDGFKQGDVVEVEVDRIGKVIKYSVNSTLKATHTN